MIYHCLLTSSAQGTVLERYEIERSIFAHLVAGMVEWRRILIRMSERESTDEQEDESKRIFLPYKEGFWRHARWRYLIALMIFGLSAYLAFKKFPGLSAGGGTNFLQRLMNAIRFASLTYKGVISIFILSASYLGTMGYVYHLYRKAKKS